MKLKLDDAGHVMVSDGKPVYVADDGKEITFDYPATLQTISRLNGEAKQHRTAKEAAEAKLADFAGIEDPAAAIKAMSTVANLDAKKLVDAGHVETIRSEAIKATEEKFKAYVEKATSLERELHGEKIGGSFARSKFIGDKLILPGPAAQKIFGESFKIEEGKVIGYDASGNKLFSRAKPGEIADFEEAMEMLVEQYPYKDNLLKASNQKGDGAKGSNGANGNNGAKTITRSQYEADPMSAAAKLKPGGGYVMVD